MILPMSYALVHMHINIINAHVHPHRHHQLPFNWWDRTDVISPPATTESRPQQLHLSLESWR